MSGSKKRQRRSFSEEFKRDAVNLVVKQGYSFKSAAEAVGASTRSIREWHEMFAPTPEPCGEDATSAQLSAEVKRLRKELQKAELERDILKKATAFFAKESQ